MPLTAKDIAFTYNWESKLQLQAFLAALDGIESASAPDDTTLIMTCSRPKADILSMWCPILPEHVWSQFKTADDAKNYLNKPPIVGSGPFQIVEWKKGKFVRCVANKEYWGGTPKADEVVFQLYTNQDTLAQDLKLGHHRPGHQHPPGADRGAQGRHQPRRRRPARRRSSTTSPSTATKAPRSATRCSGTSSSVRRSTGASTRPR